MYCTCDNCTELGQEFGRSLERCQLRKAVMEQHFACLEPFSFLHAPEFYEGPEVLSDCESEASLVMDEVGNLGDEYDYSSGEETEETSCQLWNLDFGWVHDSACSQDSSLLSGLLETGCFEPQTAQQGNSSTASTTLHETPFACGTLLGLQGSGFLSAGELTEGLVSTVGERIHLQRFATPTFLNFEDTVSHVHQLRNFTPVLDPLLSEIMMGSDCQYWWLLDSGAAATVMATASQNAYGAWVNKVGCDRFRAANGSRVDIDGSACVNVWIGFSDVGDSLGRYPYYEQAQLKCLVGEGLQVR
eukprot:s6917_g1.t1